MNLQPLAALAGGTLEHLDLNDNYIGELEQLRHLAGLGNLRELIFQGGQNGTNPLCDFENYEEAVRLQLPSLARLDSRELVPGYKASRPHSNNRQRENSNPNRPLTNSALARKKSPIS